MWFFAVRVRPRGAKPSAVLRKSRVSPRSRQGDVLVGTAQLWAVFSIGPLCVPEEGSRRGRGSKRGKIPGNEAAATGR